MSTTHAIHEDHQHHHGPDCGHASVVHDDHVDYFHDGHIHREHDGHWDECAGTHAEHADLRFSQYLALGSLIRCELAC